MQTGLVTALDEPGIQVSSYAIMAEGISTIGRNVNINHPIALKMVIFCCGRADDCVIREHDDACVISTHSDLILGTDHTITLHPAKL